MNEVNVRSHIRDMCRYTNPYWSHEPTAQMSSRIFWPVYEAVSHLLGPTSVIAWWKEIR